MAQGFPSCILDSVLKQLESPIFQSNKFHIHLHNQLQQLQSKLEIIKEVIDEAELMGVLFPDNVGKWVCELQNVLCEVDDLFDEVLTRSMPAYGMVEKARLHLYYVSFPLTLAPKIKKINRRLDGIVKEFCKCNLILTTPVGEQDKLVARKGTLRYNPDHVRDDDFQMIGRDDDKKKVIKMLFDEDPRIVVIHGRPGAGKTTLCRAVYNDEAVRRHFQIRLWVGGLIEYSSIELWKKIATELGVDWQSYGSDTGYSDISKTKRDLEEKIAAKLNETDILLILDDVPIDILKPLSRSQSFRTRSRILMSSLGKLPSTDEILAYEMDDLSKVDMLSLFEKTEIGSSCRRGTEWLPEGWLEDLGERFVRLCLRNPSLLKGVATLLCGGRDIVLWQYFLYDFDFERQYRRYSEFRDIFRALPKCQQNVCYLSLFPSDVEFRFDDLIHQFAAHGFTPLSNRWREVWEEWLCSPAGAEGMYTVDEDYRGFIVQLAGAESNMLVCTDTTDVHQVAGRHVSISSSSVQLQNGKLPDGLLKDATHRRSLLLFGDDSVPAVIRVQTLSVLFSHLRNLRVLSLQDLRLRVLPNSIGRLIHLKYLDLSGNNFVELPASICTLALWTLKLTYCSELKRFPPQITNLRTLKHLQIDMCFDLIYMPSRIAQLTGLESLDRFVVSSRKGGLRYLENLNKLSGHLSIELPRRWKNYEEDIKQADLQRKTRLASLEFKWHGAYNDKDGNDYAVLEQLKPCSSTQKLSVVNYRGSKLPGWFTSFDLKNCLTEITLCRCARCEILPPFQSMPKLKCLTLVSLHHMKEYILNDEGNDSLSPDVFFPSLRVLKIGRMPELKGCSRDMDGLSRFPDLETLEIWDCPSLIHMSPFQGIPKLQCLNLLSLDHMEYIQNDQGNDGASPDVIFPSLQVLKIDRMPVLRGWSRVDGFPRFQDIHTVELWHCPSLIHMPPFQSMPKLEFLTLVSLDRIEYILQNDKGNDGASPDLFFPSLRVLKIGEMPVLRGWSRDLNRLPRFGLMEIVQLWRCPSLEYMPPFCGVYGELILDSVSVKLLQSINWKWCWALTMISIANMVSLPIHFLTKLPHKLKIKNCCNLQMLRANEVEGTYAESTSEGFNRIQVLSIENCPEMKNLSSSLRYLIDLKELKIRKCSEELDFLCVEDDTPWETMQLLSKLKIEGFEELIALPKALQHLPELRTLKIIDCKSLERGLNSLAKLKYLTIKSCPLSSRSIEEFKTENPDAKLVVE